jgi:hypothetical protein
MNIFALQQILGYSDLTILQRHVAMVKQDLQVRMRRLGMDNMLPNEAPCSTGRAIRLLATDSYKCYNVAS